MEDTRKELERLEKELLTEDELPVPFTDDDVFLHDDILREILSEDKKPAFPDPDKIYEPEEPMEYHNYSNDYGQESLKEARLMKKQKKNEKVIIGLMITASVLCLGIIGMLIYWLEVFFK